MERMITGDALAALEERYRVAMLGVASGAIRRASEKDSDFLIDDSDFLIDEAAGAVETFLFDSRDWIPVSAVDISDYAYGLAVEAVRNYMVNYDG